MRSKRTTFAAVVVATFLGGASTALADGASENISTVTAGFASNNQADATRGGGSLFTQVQTLGNSSQAGLANFAAEQVFIDFDDDWAFDTSRVPGCTADLSALTTAQAITACKSSVIGSGQALALTPAAPNTYIELTVTAFDGPTTSAGGACLLPGAGGPPGCEFLGGLPQIILHARTDAPATTQVVRGELQDSPLGADFGKRLAVTDAPDTANDLGSLAMFNAVINKSTDVTSTARTRKRKRKVTSSGKIKITITKTATTTTARHPYVSARCQDDNPDPGITEREWDFSTTWVYDDDTTDTDTHTQKCGN